MFSFWVLSNNLELKWTGRLLTGLLNSVPKAEAAEAAQMGGTEGRGRRWQWAESVRCGF